MVEFTDYFYSMLKEEQIVLADQIDISDATYKNMLLESLA